MKTTLILIKRNIKLFFKDKGMFFTSLITPTIILILYITFLGNIYKDSYTSSIPMGINVSTSLIDGLVGGQLISSILSVSCVTVAFSSNFLLVQDKANGAIKDLKISPINPSILSISYYIASFISTLIILFVATSLCFVYLAFIGWYLSFIDVILLLIDVILLSLFGTALSSIIYHFLSTQGQISAISTIVSAAYGFICGAYMPIATFSESLQKIFLFLPGTYGTSLMRNHAMQGVLSEMNKQGIPLEITTNIKDSVDCNIYFFSEKINMLTMYLVITLTIIVLICIYIGLNLMKKRSLR